MRFVIYKNIFLICLFYFIPFNINAKFKYNKNDIQNSPKSDVFIQGFYWNSPLGGIWYDSLSKLAPQLASAGFGAIWFPSPVKGMAGGYSMGYDPYDHYDFGQYNQKGSIETRFGSRQELINAIQVFHSFGIQVFADAVMNHMNGGEAKLAYECKPYPSFPDSEYMLFNYPNGSGRFKKNASHFYPNSQTCDVNPPYHGDPVFSFGVWLAHDRTFVKDSLIVWGQYLRNILGFDGFRLDAAKHIDPIFMGPWLQNVNSGGYAVAEYYGGIDEIKTWLHYTQNVFGGDVSVFDFPLRFDLKAMCNNTSGTYDMTWLDGAGLVNNGVSGFDVSTFLENHDFDRIGWDGSIDIGHDPVIFDKHMGYAYIIFSEGRPCVWFRDYFIYGLKGKIDTLIWIRENFLFGSTTKRSGLNPYYVGSSAPQEEQARDIYVARRNGGNGKPQAFLVLNDNPTQWRGVWVSSNHPNQIFRDYTGVAIDKQAASDGRVELWAPPRGYAIYVPDTSKRINHPPYIQQVPDLNAFINTQFEYQLIYGDPNSNITNFNLQGNPSWLSISNSGKLMGTPTINDTITSNVIITITDYYGANAKDTFTITVYPYPLMDGIFEGSGVWGQPVAIADTIPGWANAMVKEIYITQDQNFYYFGSAVKACNNFNWAFLINSKPGGGRTESWSRSIVYNHYNPPDYILRGSFTNYAEFHTWTGSYWSGIGNPLNLEEFRENITTDTVHDGWVECRIRKSSLGNPEVLAVQFFLTGNQNAHATFDACPNDSNTTAWSGITTPLRYYAIKEPLAITHCNLQWPPSDTIEGGETTTIYARAFGIGITDSTGAGQDLSAWIGYSTSNTNPATWTNWIPATYNTDFNFSDEYKATIGIGMPGGVYYYASRFRYGTTNFVYGGYNPSGGGFWNGTSNISGVLTINAPPAIPTLLSPLNNAVGISINPLLSWNSVSTATNYFLQVSRDSNLLDLVINDSTITGSSHRVQGLQASTTYYWRVRSKNNYGSSNWSDIWKFTTANEVSSEYIFTQGWNLISLPLDVIDASRQHLFPQAISFAYAFHPETGYLRKDTLDRLTGYWLKFGRLDTVEISGTPIACDTIIVNSGWNLIGSISHPIDVDSILQIPNNIVQSHYFSYNRGYIIAHSIKPACGYWVKCKSPGKLILNFNSNSQSSTIFMR